MTWPLGLEGISALGTALGIGVAFGFVLERAGLGEPKKLLGLFYLEDFTMLKVMITAMATAAAVLAVLAGAGMLDLSELLVQPSYLWPQLVGGLVLGIGFAVGGY
jgi:uncharacterized protein